MKIVTSYINPDMDGISCMYALKELYNKKGEKADFYYEGEPKSEVKIVSKMFNIEIKGSTKINPKDEIILVDTNDTSDLPKIINIHQVIEIIDHHKKVDWINWNNNTKIQIELIGAAATLVAEKFKNEKVEMSKETATLLYFGIISNTMNLKIKLTSDKDIEMANWLKSKVPEINEEKVKDVFIQKTKIGDKLREEMEVEQKDKFMTISWSMGQLEVASVEEFLEQYEDKIREILHTVKIENDVQYISVNCMDILNGYSIIVAFDEETAKIIESVNNIKFKGTKAKTKELISRKELVKGVREKFNILKNNG